MPDNPNKHDQGKQDQDRDRDRDRERIGSTPGGTGRPARPGTPGGGMGGGKRESEGGMKTGKTGDQDR
jgi:hypothetical protein